MTMKRSAFLAFVAGLFVSQGAFAADLGGAPRRGMKDAPAPVGYSPPPQFSWTGIYVGAHVGYGFSDLDWQFEATPGISTSHTGDGGLLGAQIGYNVQVRQFVFGVEADMSGAFIDGGTACPNPAFDCSHTFNWLASRARSRRHRRQRQPHAALRDGGRRLGRRRP